MVDADRTTGCFVLTGSQQFGLPAGINQSVAGRVGMTRLLPLSLAEIPAERLGRPDEMLLRGGYPVLYGGTVDSKDWPASYVATYVERDIRQVLEVRDLMGFQRFPRLSAARTGQLLNLNALAGEAGIFHSTARTWMSVLKSSDFVYTPSYHTNLGKRFVQTPRLYFHVGLACWLLGIRSPDLLSVHPSRGALFETLAVSEFFKQRFNLGKPADLFSGATTPDSKVSVRPTPSIDGPSHV
jgi:hypothetical protein